MRTKLVPVSIGSTLESTNPHLPVLGALSLASKSPVAEGALPAPTAAATAANPRGISSKHHHPNRARRTKCGRIYCGCEGTKSSQTQHTATHLYLDTP